ncbi:hypothetical protein PSV08DRAFT_244515 [Bipolaris maydis]|uniref:uncharacterized protein n=1 Tax=Cochliobolus heterostrophus TaxID=5016 RepID=UPI0024D217EE|nr:hypothetical protein J3E74DRAFT_290391 [Bipolaris maydis]KAJ6273298.1 hypothetical protein PSV08DRAFT_244515 [Bipolaris maydis]KAJ6284509.1 hypothetical protein J3E71DRAFT_237526 [Bipolaris maydis]
MDYAHAAHAAETGYDSRGTHGASARPDDSAPNSRSVRRVAAAAADSSRSRAGKRVRVSGSHVDVWADGYRPTWLDGHVRKYMSAQLTWHTHGQEPGIYDMCTSTAVRRPAKDKQQQQGGRAARRLPVVGGLELLLVAPPWPSNPGHATLVSQQGQQGQQGQLASTNPACPIGTVLPYHRPSHRCTGLTYRPSPCLSAWPPASYLPEGGATGGRQSTR